MLEHSQPTTPRTRGTMATNTEALTLDSVLDQLDRLHQRATYGAVAKFLDRAPRNLMTGREREPRSSWIVSRETGKPTGYQEEQVHPALTENEMILQTAEELAAWMETAQSSDAR